jgi:UDP-GlcNAc:undecaprenyl-phosphate GlcNAc-1-phosphate transferase
MGTTQSIFPIFIFVNILLGLVFTLLVSFCTIRFARRVGLMDIPGSLPHKLHGNPVPIAGGLTLVLVLVIVGLLFNIDMLREFWKILLPAMIIFGVGIWDDFKRLPPPIKFFGQLTATGLLILLGTHVRIIDRGFLGLPGDWNMVINILITLFWVIGITNAFNFIDSMDGIMIGIAGIAVAFFLLATLSSGQTSLLRMLTLLIGCCAGLFFYNMTPASLFMGDSGAQTIGFLLAAIGIVYNPVHYPQASSWFLPILIMGVPIFDTCLVVFSRLLRRTPVYQAGRNHTYHRLVSLGYDSAHAVMVMHLAGVIFGCLGFIALNLTPLLANLVFGLTLLLGAITLIYLEKRTG